MGFRRGVRLAEKSPRHNPDKVQLTSFFADKSPFYAMRITLALTRQIPAQSVGTIAALSGKALANPEITDSNQLRALFSRRRRLINQGDSIPQPGLQLIFLQQLFQTAATHPARRTAAFTAATKLDQQWLARQ